ncbi:hypothetical protein Scep_026870 [Stephania cephalantha]|uniref:Uncharacterized protein n=1 Tax=Stephania cephalantha TaxID=152367 RepID=A0AAP0HSZ7_9MAGN
MGWPYFGNTLSFIKAFKSSDPDSFISSYACKKLVDALLDILSARRAERVTAAPQAKQDMTDALIDAEDEKGQKLSDEEIIDILIMYLNAGHESIAHITMLERLNPKRPLQYLPHPRPKDYFA